MKFLLVVVVVVGVLWLMLGRKRVGTPPPSAGGAVRRPQALLACAHCGLQMPAADAVLDGSRVYCCDAHRALGPAADPQPGGGR